MAEGLGVRAVIVSVRYSDFLAVTLPAWKRFLPPQTLFVATRPNDHDTIEVAKRHNVSFYTTNAWTETDPTCHTGGKAMFNKPLGLDVALGLIGKRPRPAVGEICVSLDADVVPFGHWPADDEFEDGVVYGLRRHKCDTHAELRLHQRGKLPFSHFAWMRNRTPCGYFQAFRWQPGIRFGSYPSAGDYDREFCYQFSRSVMRDDGYVLHMGPRGGWHNWRKRRVCLWDTTPPKGE